MDKRAGKCRNSGRETIFSIYISFHAKNSQAVPRTCRDNTYVLFMQAVLISELRCTPKPRLPRYTTYTTVSGNVPMYFTNQINIGHYAIQAIANQLQVSLVRISQ